MTQEQADQLVALAARLSCPPTKSTAGMCPDERRRGVLQMLADLHRLADVDGCIAAAWALEKLESLVYPPADADGQ